MLLADEIVRFDDAPAPPGASPWVGGAEPARDIAVVPWDPQWPAVFTALTSMIERALGDRALEIEHVGSTSVPGLPAKPVIDIDLVVADSADEASYVPALEAAGFVLRVREPWWYEHRCLVREEPRCNLHVFSPDCAEAARHRIFRNWLRQDDADRDRYSRAKRAAAAAANERGEHVMEYNARKQDVVRQIYDRAFRAAGLVT
ncbi:GrpB family protein [Microbacterium deminutum]|uniref:GrpB family protein n=1 Tax=Microbacterium deminutum TaxID=344164 RepID=A0ABP5CTD4_9MICO